METWRNLKLIEVESTVVKGLTVVYVQELIKKLEYLLGSISTLFSLTIEQYSDIPHGSSGGRNGGNDFIFGANTSCDASAFFAPDGDFTSLNFDNWPSYLALFTYSGLLYVEVNSNNDR